MKLTYSDFYQFSDATVSTTFTAHPDPVIRWRADGESEKAMEFTDCLTYGEYDNMVLPLIFRQDHEFGNKLRDVLRGGRFLYLISDRFKDLLNEHGLTGWKTFPIELYDKKGNKIEGYNGFSIIGRAGSIQKYDVPPVELGYSPRSCGCYFESADWDGNDIFLVRPAYVFITKQFAKVLLSHRISGVEIIKLTDYGDWSKLKRIL